MGKLAERGDISLEKIEHKGRGEHTYGKRSKKQNDQ